jgi:hypothetical protein
MGQCICSVNFYFFRYIWNVCVILRTAKFQFNSIVIRFLDSFRLYLNENRNIQYNYYNRGILLLITGKEVYYLKNCL